MTMKPKHALSSLSLARHRILLFAVTALGAGVGGAMLFSLDLSGWDGMLLLVALAAVLERQGTQLFTQSRVSVSAAAIIGAGILFGAPAAVPVALTVGYSAWVLRGKPVSRLVYNSATLVLAGTAAGAAYHATVDALPVHDGSLVAGAVAAGAAMWAVNAVLVGSMVSLTTGTAFTRVFRENYTWLSGHFAVMGLVALGLALSWQALGVLGFAAFVAPVAVLALALRQGAEKARGAMLDAAEADHMIREYERLLAEVESSSEPVAALIARRRGRPAA
jgi:hypothetical protein